MTAKDALQILHAYQYGDSVEIKGETKWIDRHSFDLNNATVNVIECALTEMMEREEQDAILTSAIRELKMQYDFALCHDGVIHNPIEWALYKTWGKYDGNTY